MRKVMNVVGCVECFFEMVKVARQPFQSQKTKNRQPFQIVQVHRQLFVG